MQSELIEQGKQQGIEDNLIEEALQKRKAIAELIQDLEKELAPQNP